MPYDSKTGKHYDYTEEGIEKYEEETGGMPYTPFKMKGHTLPGPNQASPAKQKGIFTKEGKKKAKAAKKEYISESKELKKSNIAILREAKKSGYTGAKEDIKAERKRHRVTKRAIKSGYRKAKRKAKTTEAPTYTGPATGTST